MKQITIETKTLDNGNIAIITPYNQMFVQKLKEQIGGARWNATKRWWVIPNESLEIARTIMNDCFGETDISLPADMMDIKFSLATYEVCNPVIVFGKVLARAYGRDTGAKLGLGFDLIEGEINSGGSRNNWKTTVNGTFIAHGITKKMLENEISSRGNNFTYEILEKKTLDIDALRKEKEKLLERIAEIDEILKSNVINIEEEIEF